MADTKTTSFEELKANIDINGVNRYNPTQVSDLEQAVDLMIKGLLWINLS
jgi:hypothetical protein